MKELILESKCKVHCLIVKLGKAARADDIVLDKIISRAQHKKILEEPLTASIVSVFNKRLRRKVKLCCFINVRNRK
jgi:hypothetical protein